MSETRLFTLGNSSWFAQLTQTDHVLSMKAVASVHRSTALSTALLTCLTLGRWIHNWLAIYFLQILPSIQHGGLCLWRCSFLAIRLASLTKGTGSLSADNHTRFTPE